METPKSPSPVRVDWPLVAVLCAKGFLPGLLGTVRLWWLAAQTDPAQLKVAAQIQWLALGFEVLEEFWLLPAFFVLGRCAGDPIPLGRATGAGLRFLGGLLGIALAAVWLFTPQLVVGLRQASELTDLTVRYVRVESLGLALGTVTRFLWIPLVLRGPPGRLGRILVLQALAQLTTDWWVLGSSANGSAAGVVGMAWGKLLVELAVLGGTALALRADGLRLTVGPAAEALAVLPEWWRRGWRSGLESLVRNLAFTWVVLRLVNAAANPEAFWIANQLLWGWLLVPILALGEALKRQVATRPRCVGAALQSHGRAAGTVLAAWVFSLPFWPSALQALLRAQGAAAAVSTAHWLVAFYALFAGNHLLDCAFYGAGRTDFMLRQTVLVNLGVFGPAFLLNQLGAWTPTLLQVTLLFGFGIAADSALTLVQFVGWRRTGFSDRIAVHPRDESLSQAGVDSPSPIQRVAGRDQSLRERGDRP